METVCAEIKREWGEGGGNNGERADGGEWVLSQKTKKKEVVATAPDV